jgi:hypothetical protein
MSLKRGKERSQGVLDIKTFIALRPADCRVTAKLRKSRDEKSRFRSSLAQLEAKHNTANISIRGLGVPKEALKNQTPLESSNLPHCFDLRSCLT